MKLTKAQKAGIQRWLESDEPHEHCPFADASGYRDGEANECVDICPMLFPGLDQRRGPHPNWFCPCHHYSLTHVRRVARKAVE